ncbi:regulator of chromosome condensation 1/beta-lactamase-inhibitor protein II [Lasiosphaeria miniovina]|uniref:Regulator of chromosome condensation 1/beta-lactamase-inhibitor protein II n=1 Tax=Lasiosphaeria miniovina TaxID=1954250 RepID=A0AA40BGJ5_9PEZI|nr:regulator of chromosome condensation 1/beta-lactamase-inhibitor protein II [Lasiosphaeria miniovina]KAK0733831.1 regulator of chromosome condensation 1/beta-lactamase-inhibitor protein II [Lasiosphaeria miniovina]
MIAETPAIPKATSLGAAKRPHDNTPDGPGNRNKRLKLAQSSDSPGGLPNNTLNPSPPLSPPGPPTLTQRPKVPLNIYVCGGNSGGELGLGPAVKSGNIRRPRLNPYLSGTVGVVHVSTGGMHGAALTLDNRILTWGVNDSGALGRNVSWDAEADNMVDASDGDSDDDDDDDDGAALNPRESTPTEVDMSAVAPGVVFTHLATTDNATFVLSNTGLLYGWGTFRSNGGDLAFSPNVEIQWRPALIPALKDVVKVCGGANHVVALTLDGSVYTWGKGTESQLGRRFSPRIVNWAKEGLLPRRVAGLKRIVDIGTGANHSFAVGHTGGVSSWGLNNAGQTGAPHNLGEYGGAVPIPTPLKGLGVFGKITQITGGSFHSLAVTHDSTCLAWGRVYSFATGMKLDSLPEKSVVCDSRGRPSILEHPTAVGGVWASFVAAASEHSVAVTPLRQVYTWGLNIDGQIGQRGDEVKTATLLNHSSIHAKKIVWAGAGGQYSMFAENQAVTAVSPPQQQNDDKDDGLEDDLVNSLSASVKRLL